SDKVKLNTDEDSMEMAGRITASLERDGNMIDIRDLLIALIALVNGFGVLTNNVAHFKRIKYLRVVSGK
ncbi:MAG: type II toxin-antitoxin system VapC family toxin, partial [Methanophagales archaeon]|nr:type II toxin-antitoxin system VapC family toxin [Methanophagales archaeon]